MKVQKMEKSLVSSYSQLNTYKMCPMFWFHSYRNKYRSEVERASTFFGNCVEAGIVGLLEGKANYSDFVRDMWSSQTKWGHTTLIENNPNMGFANNDFDAAILQPEDLEVLMILAQALKLDQLGKDAIEIYKEVQKIKKNPYKQTTDAHMQYFNKASWISLYRKAIILVESFKEQVLPRIKKVHSIQEEGILGSDGGDYKLKGYIDFVADFEGYEKPVIFDIKTSTGLYDQNKIAHSEQLAIYLSMVGEKYNTDLAGYIVLNKIINKVDSSNCSKCGHEKEGRHKTCPELKDGVRCNGEWIDKKLVKPEVQILIVSKADEQIEEVLVDYSNILKAIKHEVVYRNVDHCDMFYGSPCIYRELCHNKCTKGLFKR